MKNRKTIYGFLLALLAVSLVLTGVRSNAKEPGMKVMILDVGQGDAILIQKGDQQILIDGGQDEKAVLEGLGKYVPFWDREIEVIIATHPDADHIAGLPSVMENYTVDEVIDTGVSSTSQVYQKFKDTIKDKNITELEGEKGLKIKMGDEAVLEILYPDGKEDKNNPKDTNVTSIVAKLEYGENSFLFTGDLTVEGEEVLVKSGKDISAGILKVGHHGSKYSTSQAFLEKVKPREAVISVGAENRYGHPAGEVVDRLEADGVEIKRTDKAGDVVYDL